MVLPRQTSLVSLLAALALIPGCGAGTAPQADVLRRDSAGVAIVESPAALALAPLPWVIDTAPQIALGVLDGEASYQLHRISGVAARPGGGILVMNGDPPELRFYDADGVSLHQAGRSGDGPGEFRFPLLVPALGDDSLRIFDRAGRLSVFDPEGGFIRSHPVRLGYPVGVLGGGRLLTDENTASVGMDTPEGTTQSDVRYELVDLSSGIRDTVALVTGQMLYVTSGARPSFTQVPFDVATSAAVAADRFYLTAGEAPEISMYDSAGGLRGIWRLALEREPVSRAAFDRVVESRLSFARTAADSLELRRRYGRMPVPALRPTIQRLLVDRLGHLWVERFRVDPTRPRQWFVLDPTGRALGMIETPARFLIEEIGPDYLLGWWPAGEDVERVGRFGLRRAP